MTSLRGLYGKRDDGTVESNYGVDFVVNHKIPSDGNSPPLFTWPQF